MELKQMIADWIRLARTEAGLSGAALGAQLALALGTVRGHSKANISHWETGKHSPNLSQLLAIAKITGKSLPPKIISSLDAGAAKVASESQTGSRPESATSITSNVEDGPSIVGALKRVPVVGRVQAGPDGMLHIDDFTHGDGYMLWWSICASTYALRIRGESMSPRYLPGEFVGVDPCADVDPSDEVIVLLKSGERMIKRLLWLREGQACFESVNKDFQNIIVDMEEIDALHLVLGHIPKAAFRSA